MTKDDAKKSANDATIVDDVAIDPADGLTAKQRLFAYNYVLMLNGTQAAKAAGYGVNGAHVEASRLLRNANVKRLIDNLFDQSRMSAKEVIGQLTALATADIAAYLEEVTVTRNGEAVVEWRFNLLKAMRDGQTSMIKSVKRDRYGTVVELFDKVRILELIGKHHRLFADVSIQSTKPDATANDLSDDELASIAARQKNKFKDTQSPEADDSNTSIGNDEDATDSNDN